ncbi:MAG: O-antigen ligase family protein [Candidatus Hodarchaeota archaeon]
MLVWIYIILICYMPLLDSFLPRTSFGPGIPDLSFSRVFSYITILAFILQCCITSSIKINIKWIGLLLLFSMIEIASITWSPLRLNLSIIQSFFDIIFIPFCIALVAMNVFDEQKNTNKFIHHIVLVGAILGMVSMFQFIRSVLAGMQAVRTTGTFENPNALAIFLVLIIPAALLGIEKGTIEKKIGLISLASIFSGIICTVSRKGLFTAALTICIYLWLKKRYKILVLVAIFIGGFAVFSSSIGHISQRFEADSLESAIDTKWNMVIAGLNMFKDSPIIGLGYEGYFENFSKYMPNPRYDKFDAHNIFITVLANYGILGTIPFLWLFLYPLSVSIKVLRRIKPGHPMAYLRDNAIFCIASVIPFLINGWFAGGLLRNTITISLLYSNIAVMVAVRLTAQERRELTVEQKL